MRTIAHLSDLHFGRIAGRVADELVQDLAALAPSLVVISGDLVQRAGPNHFRAARAFLDRLTGPVVIVPGNHDIPAFNLFLRFARPFDRYQHFVHPELNPVHVDHEIAVIGVNTARSWVLNFAHGRINRRQIAWVKDVVAGLPPQMFKILVTHHPFLPPPDAPSTRLVGRARLAVPEFARAGIDLMLAGHLHRGYAGDVADHHGEVEGSILVGHAATATSTRVRREPNSYSLISIARGDRVRVTFDARTWTGERFVQGWRQSFERSGDRWASVAATPPPAAAAARASPVPVGAPTTAPAAPAARPLAAVPAP